MEKNVNYYEAIVKRTEEYLDSIKKKSERDMDMIRRKTERDVDMIKRSAEGISNGETKEDKKEQSVSVKNENKRENRNGDVNTKGTVVERRVGSEADLLLVKLVKLRPENRVAVGNFVAQVVRARESGRINESEERTLLVRLGERLIKAGVRPDMVSEYVMDSLERSGERISPRSEERVEKTMNAFEDRVMRLMKEERERERGQARR